MSIIDELLGSNGSQESGSINESDNTSSFATDPSLSVETGDILSFSSSDYSSDGNGEDVSANDSHFTLVDGLGLDASAPTENWSSDMSDSADYSDTDSSGGGLLGGLV
ncbi:MULTISPECIES: hypothetical protein [unclassified Rhizobium]|uniref:hypothetical protein n=1 Tax=unclassified Rhizobium TaxID=2613769 RepID=UPI003D2B2AAB